MIFFKGQKKDYQPYVDDTADLNTIHEAYQFMMKTYVDDILEQKSKQQKLIQALGILEIPFTKFHTLYLGDKLIELRQLFDEAMIERVRAYHHCKQTAELNCIKVTKDDFEPFLLKV